MAKPIEKQGATEINRANQITVLRLVRENEGISRAEISRLCGLSRPAVSSIVDTLINKHRLVIETGFGEAAGVGGRRPRCLAFNGTEHFIIGVDVGTTKISAVVANLNAHIKAEKSVPTQYESGFENVMSRCSDAIDAVIAESGIASKRILGIGVAIGGLVNRNTHIVEFAPKFGWEDVDPVAELSKRTDIPVICDYVVRVMTLGEKWYGKGAQYDDFLCVSLGHGMGAGMVIDGDLFYGSAGMCGELGHIPIDKDSDVVCKCGNKGCLSALASGYGIARAAERAIKNGNTSEKLLAMCDNDTSQITAEMVANAAKLGDPLAQKVLSQAAEYIGLGIATMIHLFNPEAIFIGGGVVQSGEILFETIKKTIEKHTMKKLAQDVELNIVTHGMKATTMGTIALILREVLSLNITVS